ncbi:MAG TPA: hypothetical protein PKA27_02165 [Fimbriimonadaceae bacterium]|nr:hypothetical protein [Fimbriimonadaceae bacterium]
MHEQRLSCTSLLVPIAMIAGAIIGAKQYGVLGAIAGIGLGFLAATLLILISLGVAFVLHRVEDRRK